MKLTIKYFLIVFLLWIIGLLFGVNCHNNMERSKLPLTSADTTSTVVHKITKALDADNHTKAFILIAKNNLSVSIINVVGGVFFGLPVLCSMLFNGFAFGTTYGQMYSSGITIDFMLKYTLPHSFELVAIWGSAAIGLLIARKLIIIIRNKEFPTSREYKQLVINLVIIAITIVLAAFVEAFITVKL